MNRGTPSNLVYRATCPPWGDTFLPKSKPPARRLLLVEGAGLKAEERVALACLQGLTSRQRPCLWLRFNGLTDFWLDWHVARGHIEGYDTVSDWRGLFKQFNSACKGAVVPDSDLYRGELLAAHVAACEDLIIATPELAAELGIPVKVDLRKRFTTYADGMEWVWQTYSKQLNRHLCNYLHPARLGNGAFAYDIQWRSVMLWPAGKKDGSLPGADPEREKRLTAQILSELAPNSAVLGFPYAGDEVGLGEVWGVKLASQYAKPLVCNDALANLSVMSGIQLPRLVQPAQPPTPVLDKSKIYVALTLSDGDNQNCWLAFMKRYFDHKRFGEFPLAFGMGPPIIDLMPAVAQWYYEKGGSGTEFIADVSGIGYIQPENYGTAFTDRAAAYDGFLDWTALYLKRLDMGTVRTVEGGDERLTQYARKIPGMHSLFADMGRYSGREGITNLTYTLPEGMPVFRAATSWRFGTNSFPREVREQVGSVRPAFVNAFLHCWTYKDFELICDLYDARSSDMVFVTPRQLAALYKQAHRAEVRRPPNIVMILADDLGYGSLNCYGVSTNFVRTPNCDRLAREGVRFTDAHTPSSVCSPTRYGLLTGRYSWRTGQKWGVVNMFDPLQIETNRLTVASLLKRKGYSTAAVGKWHLGFGGAQPVNYTSVLRPGPQDVGFDYFYGIAQNHGDMTGVYLENDGVEGLRSAALSPYGRTFYRAPYMGLDAPQRDEPQVMSVLTDKALGWLKRQDPAKPFFLYFAPVAVHHPCTPSDKTKGTSGCGTYGDWIHELDVSVGRLLDGLEANRQKEDTLVILTSDNGGVVMPKGTEPEADAYAVGFRACGAWRGGKHSIFEGGTRVPYLARWPGRIKPGRVCDETISLVDTLATVAALVGEPLPPPGEAAEDSFNVLPALLGEPYQAPLRPNLILHSGPGVYAVRQGPWKWIEGKPAQPGQDKVRSAEYVEQLYRLADDPGETKNLLLKHPEIASGLRTMLERARNSSATRDKATNIQTRRSQCRLQ